MIKSNDAYKNTPKYDKQYNRIEMQEYKVQIIEAMAKSGIIEWDQCQEIERGYMQNRRYL